MTAKQQANVTTSLCFAQVILAQASKHKRQQVVIDTEDLQALVDEVKRLSKDDGEC